MPLICSAQINIKNLDQKINKYIQPYIKYNVFSGNILIGYQGRVVFQKSYGLANYALEVPFKNDTKFQIASISKRFTDAALLILQKQGKLFFSDTIGKYITGFPNGNKITIQHLIDHQSGIVGDFKDFTREYSMEETLDSIRQIKLAFEPGTKTVYSNHGYRLLAFLIEKVSGTSYGEFLTENIFVPAGMSNTHH